MRFNYVTIFSKHVQISLWLLTLGVGVTACGAKTKSSGKSSGSSSQSELENFVADGASKFSATSVTITWTGDASGETKAAIADFKSPLKGKTGSYQVNVSLSIQNEVAKSCEELTIKVKGNTDTIEGNPEFCPNGDNGDALPAPTGSGSGLGSGSGPANSGSGSTIEHGSDGSGSHLSGVGSSEQGSQQDESKGPPPTYSDKDPTDGKSASSYGSDGKSESSYNVSASSYAKGSESATTSGKTTAVPPPPGYIQGKDGVADGCIAGGVLGFIAGGIGSIFGCGIGIVIDSMMLTDPKTEEQKP